MICGTLNPEKARRETLQICPPRLADVATLPWEIQKVAFDSTVHDYLRYPSRKQTVIHLPTHLKMSARELVN